MTTDPPITCHDGLSKATGLYLFDEQHWEQMQLTAKKKPNEIPDPFELFWAIDLVGSMGQSCSWLMR